MGTPNTEAGRFNNEGPQCQVTVSSFYMSKYQVTQQEYAGIMGKNPAYFKGKGLPAETVSWFDAIAYCNARSLKEGLTPAYTGSGADIRWDRKANGYRLPTEAEWEYACRAGTTTRYWSGNGEETLAGKANAADLSAQKRYKNWAIVNIQDGFVHTAPVGKFMANPWGLYDMHGNVWEWCWDRYGSYSARSKTDPYGPLFGAGRVMRGGSWYNSGYKLRSGFRNYDIPSAKYNNVGFRIVRNA
ncbi:MAG: formylglycine-generating enzyme family protein [Treponema sp.]|nr:formylglycine-generating enzyme family protein [Treponema sp.]